MSARRTPLPPREFARALRYGLGRARIDAERHGLRGREGLIVEACLRDATRIRELEGSTAKWLVDVAKAGGAFGAVSRAVRLAAARPIRRRRDRAHVARVLEHLTLAGDAASGAALVAMLRRARKEDLVEVGVPVVRALGEDGWREVVATFRTRGPMSPAADLGWLAVVARAVLGTRRALAALDGPAGDGPSEFVRRMRETIRKEGRRRSSAAEDPRPACTLDELERMVASRRRRRVVPLLRWAAFARPADRDAAWRRVRVESDPGRLRRRLRAMVSEEPSRLRPGMFVLARHPHPRVRHVAVSLLARVRHPSVRRWALAALRRDPASALRDGVLRTFELNARRGDDAAVARALPRRRSAEADHDWVRGALCAARPIAPGRKSLPERCGPAWNALLVRAYWVSSCRDCRRSVVETLAGRGAAPEWMVREAAWDSQEETRALARRALRDLRTVRRR